MSTLTASPVLLLVVIWPLLLAAGSAFALTRPAALRLVPWAALPALVTAVAHSVNDSFVAGIGGGLVGWKGMNLIFVSAGQAVMPAAFFPPEGGVA